LEANGTLYPGQVIFADLLDEVVIRAWLQFGDRPRWMSLDLWLTKILDEILEEQTHDDERIQRSLDEPADSMLPQNAPQVDDQEWWLGLLGEDDTVTQDNAISSRESNWPEQFLEAEELLHRIHSLLGGLARTQRQAFILNVLEAYDITEIAMLQCRPEIDVQTDIESARNHLRDRLRAGDRSQTADQAAEVLANSSRRPK
jgi:DNA-directed RNA polymerase specialized sigma24 family protein